MKAEEFVTFTQGGQRYGIPIVLVREINKHLELTPVQNAPAFIRGLANLRGRIITVFDTPGRLGLTQKGAADHTHCIVLKTHAELLLSPAVQERPELLEHAGADLTGLLVEEVSDVVRGSGLEPVPPNLQGAEARLLSGVLKLKEELVLILDMREVLDLPNL